MFSLFFSLQEVSAWKGEPQDYKLWGIVWDSLHVCVYERRLSPCFAGLSIDFTNCTHSGSLFRLMWNATSGDPLQQVFFQWAALGRARIKDRRWHKKRVSNNSRSRSHESGQKERARKSSIQKTFLGSWKFGNTKGYGPLASVSPFLELLPLSHSLI